MNPIQIEQAIRQVISDDPADITALQIIMLGPDVAEVKVRIGDQCYQDVVRVTL